MTASNYYMGIDLGSISLNLVIIDDEACIQASTYKRTEGKPLAVLLESLEDFGNKFDSFQGVIATGSGRKLLGNILKVPDINEIVTQAKDGRAGLQTHLHVSK